MEATSVALLRRREREDGFAPSIGFHKAAIRGFRRTSLTKLRHRGCVNTASFSQNGCSLLTGSDDLSLKVWDVVSCALKGDVLTRHQHNIFAAAFCRHDSSQLLSGAADGTVRLSSLNSISTSDSPLLQSENIVHTLILDVESPHVVYVAEEAGYVSRIDMRSRGSQHIFWNKQRSRNSLSSQLRCVKALAQSNVLGSSQLFVGGFGFDVGVLDLRALPPENADVMADEVFTHSFSPLARSARTYPAISSWRSRSDSMLPVSNPMVSGLCLSEGGRSLLVNYQGDQIYAFDTPLAEYGEEHPIGARNCYGGHVNYNTFLKNVTYFGPRDEYVAAGSDQGALFIWAADSGRLLPSSAHYCTTHGLGSLSDEKLADRIACRLVNVLNADSSTCNGVAAHPFLPMLASYGIDSTAKLWSFKTDEDDNHTTSMRPSDRYIPFLESYGPESVMKRMPTILAQNLAGQLSPWLPNHPSEVTVSVNYGSVRTASMYDVFSYHRTVAGLQAQLSLTRDCESAEYPEDDGLLSHTTDVRSSVVLTNALSDQDAKTNLAVLMGELGAALVEQIHGLDAFIRTYERVSGLRLGMYAIILPSRAASVLTTPHIADALVDDIFYILKSSIFEFFSAVFATPLDDLLSNEISNMPKALELARLLQPCGNVVSTPDSAPYRGCSAYFFEKALDMSQLLRFYFYSLLMELTGDSEATTGQIGFKCQYDALPPSAKAVLAVQGKRISDELLRQRELMQIFRLYTVAHAARHAGNNAYKTRGFKEAVGLYLKCVRYLQRLNTLQTRLSSQADGFLHPYLPHSFAPWADEVRAQVDMETRETAGVSDSLAGQKRGYKNNHKSSVRALPEDESNSDELSLKLQRTLVGDGCADGMRDGGGGGDKDVSRDDICEKEGNDERSIDVKMDTPSFFSESRNEVSNQDSLSGDVSPLRVIPDRCNPVRTATEIVNLEGGSTFSILASVALESPLTHLSSSDYDNNDDVDWATVHSVDDEGDVDDDESDDQDWETASEDESTGEEEEDEEGLPWSLVDTISEESDNDPPALVESSDNDCEKAPPRADCFEFFFCMCVQELLDELTPTLLRVSQSNLANSYYMLKNYAAVIDVVSNAFVSNGSTQNSALDSKLYFRRGLSRLHLEDSRGEAVRDYRPALADLVAAHTLDSGNASIAKHLSEARLKVRLNSKLQAKKYAHMFSS